MGCTLSRLRLATLDTAHIPQHPDTPSSVYDCLLFPVSRSRSLDVDVGIYGIRISGFRTLQFTTVSTIYNTQSYADLQTRTCFLSGGGFTNKQADIFFL